MIVSEATYRLAGRMEGLTFSDRGRVHLKNIADPIHVLQVYSELDAEAAPNRWVLMFFGKPARQFGWKLAAGVAGLGALTAAGVVYVTTGDHTDGGSASLLQSGSPPAALPANAGLDAIVPEAIWRDCHVQTVAEPGATQTAVHERLGEPSHKDVLVIARESGSDHAGLTKWWRPWHHEIGKAT